MPLLNNILFIILGLALLLKGADWFVEGASSFAKRLKVSELAIGLTIVAFGTSAPELIVNGFAAAENHPGIVFGNIIGSNNINLFVILGLAGIIFPLNVQSSTAWKEIPFSFFILLLLFILANDQLTGLSETPFINRFDGLLLLLTFGLFMWYVYKQLKTDPAIKDSPTKLLPVYKVWIFIIIGLAGLVIGGRLVVNHAVELASHLGINEKIIGLTIVALGTSLPELATSVVAASKNNADIAVGNIIGSNIFNILLILSISAFIKPLEYEASFNNELMILAGGTAFLYLAMYTGRRKKLDKWEALLMLVFFLGYTTILVLKNT